MSYEVTISTVDEYGTEYVHYPHSLINFDIKGSPSIDPATVDDEILRIFNSLRKSKGLALFVKHSALKKSAEAHAAYMVASGNFSHYGLRGTTWVDRAAIAGYKGASLMNIGENIGMGQQSCEQIVNDWKASPGHYRQIISVSNHHVGSAVAIAKNGTLFWCSDFGWGAPDEKAELSREEFIFL